MELQKFVMNAIEAMGGAVVQTEYALCEAIVPDQWKGIFQGRTECLLAFDFEVAEENPAAEFVTFGSYIFEQIVSNVRSYAASGVRYVDIERPALHNPLEKIKRYLKEESGAIQLKSERPAIGLWVEFSFRIQYVSDEKETTFKQIWVNLNSGCVDEEMRSHKDFIPYAQSPSPSLTELPLLDSPVLSLALLTAYDHVKQLAGRGLDRRMRQEELDKELRRITDYYDDLSAEMAKRGERKGLSADKMKEHSDKAEAILAEKAKQMDDIRSKYSVRTEIELDHGLLYFVPVIDYTVEIEFRKKHKQIPLQYNPFLKKFDMCSSTY